MTPLRGGVALTLDPFTGREGGESLDCALITASFVVPYDRLILLLWSLASGTSKIRPRFVYSARCRDSLGLSMSCQKRIYVKKPRTPGGYRVLEKVASLSH
ncbi:hypothetical protein CEXT_194901 [Caerostris extrusa]|uniref:Uncharacterized protein n=1 Tax=Caerostris extrusa TaxID=172846 RepID=A0AAV4M6J9_CAEEX|nr:hypothetical protein CEXT_194901 [Caerostris extrusa]